MADLESSEFGSGASLVWRNLDYPLPALNLSAGAVEDDLKIEAVDFNLIDTIGSVTFANPADYAATRRTRCRGRTVRVQFHRSTCAGGAGARFGRTGRVGRDRTGRSGGALHDAPAGDTFSCPISAI